MESTAPHDLNPEALLAWYMDAGVDEAVGEVPLDRFQLAAEVKAAKPQPQSQPQSQPQPQPGTESAPALPPRPKPLAPQEAPGTEAALKSAVELAGAAKTLDELRGALEGFDGCALKKTAMNLVFGDGAPDAKIVLIGEAPGADEDRQGIPFVGASGQLLDRMLASIGLDRSAVFISNTVFWRPPGNRTPNAGEIAVCMPFVERIIELIDPEILVTVGGPAAHSLLAQQGSVSKLTGRWFTYETPRMSRPVQATAIYHPAYLLRTPAAKRTAWANLLMIQDKLREVS